MGTFLSRLKAARTVDVEVEGIGWRVKVVTPLEVLAAGAKAIPRIEAKGPVEPGEEQAAAPIPSDPADILAMMEQGLENARDFCAIVCAAVTHVRPPDGEWEPCTLVLELADEGEGSMWVGTLPPSTQMQIMFGALAAQGGAMDRVIATFHSEPS